MSIPPLVCSTPPPPDQCEDDKDPEDFDLQYNLSQEDDDDNYEFGSFSTFNHFQSSQNKPQPVEENVNSKSKYDLCKEQENDAENISAVNNIDEGKQEEENVIEDLNLEDLKVIQDVIEKCDETEVIIDSKTIESTTDPVQDTEPPGGTMDFSSSNNLQSTSLQPDEYVIDTPSFSQSEEPPSYVDEIIAAVDNMQISPSEAEIPFDELKVDELEHEIPKDGQEENIVTSELVIENSKQEVINYDDFGDFDDFQFASLGKSIKFDICDNPWENSDEVTDNDFGDFKAKFDDNDNIETRKFSSVLQNLEHSTEDKLEMKVEESVPTLTSVADTPDDDFGDFNDFQSSSAEPRCTTISESEEPSPLQHLPLLDLQMDDDAIMEQINNVINSIFIDEIEPAEAPTTDLETILGVTWGYLLQTEERQPYMVNWNNSAGQKTLLKALGIDSRNILFGPKWNHNMPKYAATLSVAPLQPQKPISSPSVSQETSQLEKPTSKPNTWSDPFTSEGQESCNPEATSDNPVVETGPTDLDVFEASTSSKPDKIFSNTINVQPLRQINLPDTHIFTPTDSETPRSTTIHYDNSPTVLLPHTVTETSKIETNLKIEPNLKSETKTLSSNTSATSTADSDEYWEFQDFKGPSNITHTVANTTPLTGVPLKANPNVAYATQVLQPIKVEPIIPTLNWPDPGEVKETFDDFSEFISSTTLSNTQQQIPTVPVQIVDSKLARPITAVATSDERVTNDNFEDFDDDFDTFQSAVPSTSSVDFNFTSRSKDSNEAGRKPIISPQAPPQTITDFEFAFPKIENVKSDTISFESTNKLNDTALHNSAPLASINLTVKIPPVLASSSSSMKSSLLQPTLVNSKNVPNNNMIASSKQKTGQILQPLSLESFSQINWPNPGIDLQDLSRFNPVETLNSLKSDLSANNPIKVASPVHGHKSLKNTANSHSADDDWGEFVSSKPKPQTQPMPKKQTTIADDDEWTDFVSSPSVKPQQNGLNTISLNVHTNFQSNPSKFTKGTKLPLEIPTLNYITPKSSSHKNYNERHFQNL